MIERSSDSDLADAVVAVAAPDQRKRHDPGFVITPVRVKVRSKGASAIARSLIPCLLELHSLRKPEQPLILSNELAEECSVSRKLKRRALEELAARQIIVLYPQDGRKNPRFEFVAGVLR